MKTDLERRFFFPVLTIYSTTVIIIIWHHSVHGHRLLPAFLPFCGATARQHHTGCTLNCLCLLYWLHVELLVLMYTVTQDGKVYACGEATNGRLGLGLSSGSVTVPRQLSLLSQYVVRKVAVHSGTSLTLSSVKHSIQGK